MRNGDLSNKVAPRVYIVFENCVAFLPDENAEEYTKLTTGRKANWVKAMECWEINTLMASKIDYLAYNKDVNFTLVSWLDKEAQYGIEYLVAMHGIMAGILMSTPEEMTKELVSRPDVIAIYDPDPNHILTFGSKALTISKPSDLRIA